MEEFRPEYVEAINSARWNAWWIVVLVFPILLMTFTAINRRFGCVAFPIACAITWFSFVFAVEYYWDVKAQSAVTDAEIADASADTGRLFGPAAVGGPLVFAYVTVVTGLVYGTTAVIRSKKLKRQKHVKD